MVGGKKMFELPTGPEWMKTWGGGGNVSQPLVSHRSVRGSNFSSNIISPPSLRDISCPPYGLAAAGGAGVPAHDSHLVFARAFFAAQNKGVD